MAFALRQFIKPLVFSLVNQKSAKGFQMAVLRQAENKTSGTATSTASNTNQSKLLISDSCLNRLREICKDDTNSFLRITVEGGGCSGFQYKFDLDNKLCADDLIFGEDQAKVVIDKISIEFCAGATVDYHVELIRSGFRMLANPLAEQGCSCGASFAIK